MKINLFGSNGPDYNVLNDEINEEANKDDAGGLVDETENNTAIYQSPNKETNENNEEQGLDNMINRADDFLEQGDAELKYDKEALQTFSRTMYNILLSVGVAVAAIVGGILGIKFMSASVEGKAEVKKQLIAYLIGCVVVFGGFVIWKLIVDILQNV